MMNRKVMRILSLSIGTLQDPGHSNQSCETRTRETLRQQRKKSGKSKSSCHHHKLTLKHAFHVKSMKSYLNKTLSSLTYQNKFQKIKKEPHRTSRKKMSIKNIAIEINKKSVHLKLRTGLEDY